MYPQLFKIDSETISRLKNGDEAAFSVIYERYYSKIYNFIYSFLKQKQLSEEVLQETFIDIWTQRKSIDPDKPLEYLLFTICRRNILDNFRKITSTEALKKQLKIKLSELTNATEEVVLYNDMVSFTNEAIERLPNQQKRIFKLSRIEGRSYEEISEELHLSKNTVRNHMVAALKTLRLHFEDQGLYYIFIFLFINS